MLNTTDKIIKHKTGLLNLAEELGKRIESLPGNGLFTRHVLSLQVGCR